MSHLYRYLASLAAVSALAVVGCKGDDPPKFSFEGVTPASLERAQSCEDLERMLKDDAAKRMNRYIDLQIASIRYYEDGGWFHGGPMEEGDMGDASTGSGGGSAGEGGAPSHSETNTQVEGVDEADIVKTDGERLFVLHGRTLSVLRSWPIADLGVAQIVTIEGHPIEMFVDGDTAVVYSSTDAAPVYASAGKPAPNADSYCEWGCYYPLTKITVIDLAQTVPVAISEHYVEGRYVSARRIGQKVHTVVSGGRGEVFDLFPEFFYDDYDDDDFFGGGPNEEEMIEAYEKLRAKNMRAIEKATLDDLLPDRFASSGGVVQESQQACEDVYVPTAGSTDFGVTQIHTLDIASGGQTIDSAVVFGATSTIYQNHDKLILASPSWSAILGAGPWWEVDEPTSLVGTHLHVFALTDEDTLPVYRASATVPGSLDDQFSLDEKDGVVRIATTETIASSEEWTTENDLFTLRFDGRLLVPAGEVRNLAPGEQIYTTRYVGSRAYVVTFRQVDPLFVIDTSIPEKPVVLGELKIPGFSEYMHPIENGDYLLTVGMDGNDAGINGGIALQIFDVRDPLAPQLAHKLPLSDNGGWSYSEALYNHKAFTFHEGMLAIPIEGPSYDDYELRSGLGLFRIDVVNGITELGRIDHSPYFQSGRDYCYYGHGVRRGVFIDDHVLSVSAAAVVATPVTDPTAVTATVELPDVDLECNYYY
jgi:hypothetical protein